MPPKKGAAKGVPMEDEEIVKKKMKRVKEITEKWLHEAHIEPDSALVNKIYDSQVESLFALFYA